mmetsp:Transcript_42612/g.76561  ORF Transcript_42612/g.76561 Transcript_42612/m.76561 type:complete len:164 (-) Transcript_42612:1070-1561(-)
MKDIPTVQLTDDSEQVWNVPESPSNKKGMNAKSKRQKAVEYFVKTGIPQTMDVLTTQLLAQRPDNPISFCVAILRDNIEQLHVPRKSNLSDEELKQRIEAPGAQEYLLAHKLPWLFDDLLSSIAIEQPEVPHVWAMAWLKRMRLSNGEPLDEKADYLNGVPLL